jgi:hypothetical protein
VPRQDRLGKWEHARNLGRLRACPFWIVSEIVQLAAHNSALTCIDNRAYDWPRAATGGWDAFLCAFVMLTLFRQFWIVRSVEYANRR